MATSNTRNLLRNRGIVNLETLHLDKESAHWALNITTLCHSASLMPLFSLFWFVWQKTSATSKCQQMPELHAPSPCVDILV